MENDHYHRNDRVCQALGHGTSHYIIEQSDQIVDSVGWSNDGDYSAKTAYIVYFNESYSTFRGHSICKTQETSISSLPCSWQIITCAQSNC